MAKKQVITKQKIASTLQESVFTPTTPGPLRVIIDVGDIDYYIKRSIELLLLASRSDSGKQKLELLTQAISLSAVSKILIRHNQNES